MKATTFKAMEQRQILRRQALVLVLALVATGLASDAAQWAGRDVIATLAVLSIGSHLLPLTARGIHISGSFMGIVLTMALAGPAPAVAIGVAAVLLDALLRTRPPLWHLMTDLVTYSVFPLAGGLLFEAMRLTGIDEEPVVLAVIVGIVFVATNALNFVLVVEQTRLFRPAMPRLPEMLRLNFLPVLPWQLAAATATATAAYGEAVYGLPAVGILVLILFTFQLLLRAVLDAEHRRDELAERFDELAQMHQGLLAAMLHTLGLRDPMTARHSAAVARYARAVAVAAGMEEADCDLAHTAGLLHDIGKASFDDALLTSAGRLTDEQYAVIRGHPEAGARILRAVHGYDDVAEIVLHHHERWDGGGYPRGIAAQDIPAVSRIISVADTYDVMTARDSYREPVSHAEAIAELRRVSGTQLDARFVDLFVELAEAGGMVFGHADDRDLEAELTRRPRRTLAGSRERPASA